MHPAMYFARKLLLDDLGPPLWTEEIPEKRGESIHDILPETDAHQTCRRLGQNIGPRTRVALTPSTVDATPHGFIPGCETTRR